MLGNIKTTDDRVAGSVGAAGRPQSSQQGVNLMCREAIFISTDVILLHSGAITRSYEIAFRQKKKTTTICSTKVCFNNFNNNPKFTAGLAQDNVPGQSTLTMPF